MSIVECSGEKGRSDASSQFLIIDGRCWSLDLWTLVSLTNLLPAPSDSCLTCLIYTSIACHIKLEAELQNFQLPHLCSNAFQLSCAVTIDSSAERGFIPRRATTILPALQPTIPPPLSTRSSPAALNTLDGIRLCSSYLTLWRIVASFNEASADRFGQESRTSEF